MLKAVIFDFDGVIVDSEELHYKAFAEVLKSFGKDLTKDVYYSRYLGFSDAECLPAFAEDFGLDLSGGTGREFLDSKVRIFDQIAGGDNTIIAGAPEFIMMLQSQGIRIAMNTGALRSDVRLLLSGSDLLDAFEVVVSADDVAKGKPHPDGYLLAVDQLNGSGDGSVTADDCIVIEDSMWGLDSARKAGLKHRIAVTNTYTAKELEGHAELVVDGLGGLSIERLRELCE